MIDQFIRDWLPHILCSETPVFDNADNTMIDMMNGRRAFDRDIVRGWSHRYKILNRINAETKNNIIDCARTYIACNNTLNLSHDAPDEIFRNVYRQFYNTHNRKWLSLTSKYLWCKFPNDFPMYDRFAYRAICVLQSIHPALADLDAVGREDPKGPEVVCPHYARYRAHVVELTQEHQELINQIKQAVGSDYPYNLRIMDKLLWHLGNGQFGSAPPPVAH